MEKAISFLILIFVGILFRNKIKNKEQIDTIKTLILTLALPAAIFSALVKIKLNSSLIYFPLIVIAFNFLIFVSVRFVLPLFIGKNGNRANMRTLMLMLSSFAPYLSCFPFIAEFSNESNLGIAAIADTGNKIFILVFLYLLAMYWSYSKEASEKQKNVFQQLSKTLLQPINLTIILALTVSMFDVGIENIPMYFQDSIAHLRNLLTPTILIFIGLAAKVKGKDLKFILGLLLWRSGITFLLSGLLLCFVKIDSVPTILLMVAFPQSSCSFIPYAQMTICSELQADRKNIFNQSLALSLLAISLPFSALIILSIYSSGSFFTSPVHLFELSFAAIVGSAWLLKQKAQKRQTVFTLVQQRSPENKIPRSKTNILG